MANKDFPIRYPLFTIRTGPEHYLKYTFPRPKPEPPVNGIPVFTSEGRVADFLKSANLAVAEIKVFEREYTFRLLLQAVSAHRGVVVFDPVLDREGLARGGRPYSPPELLTRTADREWHFDYPIYVLRGPLGGVFSINVNNPGGTRTRCLAVYTDQDLADRAVSWLDKYPWSAEPVPDRHSFARILRSVPADMTVVALDPPTFGPADTVHIRGCPRELAIADLEFEL